MSELYQQLLESIDARAIVSICCLNFGLMAAYASPFVIIIALWLATRRGSR